jgi:hypothetical protein
MTVNDTLARLREAALKSSAAPAPAAQAAPATPAASATAAASFTQPPAASAAPAPTPPAPLAAAAAPQAAPAATPPAAQLPSTTTEAPPSKVYVAPETVTSDEAAVAMLKLLHGSPQDNDKEMTVSDLYDETNSGIGVSFSHPFAQVVKGSFKTLAKHCPKEFLEFMPDGTRPFNFVYLGYRIGATSWTGKPGDGKPPAFKFAVPTHRVNPQATEMMRQIIAICSKIQYKKVHESKYMHLGKMVPEIHIFGWKLTTGFICLNVTGHKAVELTSESLDDSSIVKWIGKGPVAFTITEHLTENTKMPIDALNRKWKDYPILASVLSDDKAGPGSETAALRQQWEAFYMPNIRTIANQIAAFNSAADFKGLNIDEIKSKLSQYTAAMA